MTDTKSIKKSLIICSVAIIAFFFLRTNDASASTNYLVWQAPTDLQYQTDTTNFDYTNVDTLYANYGSDSATGTTIGLYACLYSDCRAWTTPGDTRIVIDEQSYGGAETSYNVTVDGDVYSYVKFPAFGVCIDNICETFDNEFRTQRIRDTQNVQDIRIVYGIGILIFLFSTLIIIKTYTP